MNTQRKKAMTTLIVVIIIALAAVGGAYAYMKTLAEKSPSITHENEKTPENKE